MRNPKLEIGDKPTAFCIKELELDDYGQYNHGFIENGDMMKIYENAIETTEFIEY